MAADIRKIAAAQGNGDSAGVSISRFSHLFESRLRTFFVQGTFDSATVKLQLSVDSTDGLDGIWHDVVDADAITAKTLINVEFRAPWVRINVAGGAGSEAIDAWLV